MVKVRLTRTGAKKAPFYRVIVTDSRAARNSAFLEIVGYYDPIKQPEVIHLKKDRLDYWVSVGAQLTDTVASLVRRHARAAKEATQA
jgi:small subunit ribosomal protein S16